jgi:hypothetical protein
MLMVNEHPLFLWLITAQYLSGFDCRKKKLARVTTDQFFTNNGAVSF